MVKLHKSDYKWVVPPGYHNNPALTFDTDMSVTVDLIPLLEEEQLMALGVSQMGQRVILKNYCRKRKNQGEVNSELQNVFKCSTSHDSSHSGVESTIAKASKLIKDLSSNPIAQMQMYTRRKGKGSARRDSSRKFHRNLVCIDYYQQPNHTLRQHNKVFEGFITLSSSMTESIVRNEIIEKLKDKDYLFYNFDTLTSNDFEFVKCVNRHIFVPDGATAYDGNGIMSLYRSGSSIYIRLTRPFSKHEQSSSSNSSVTEASQSSPLLLVSVTAPTILSPTSTILAQPSSLCVSPSVHAPTEVSASNVSDVIVSPSVDIPVDVSASPSSILSVMPSVYAPTAVSVSSLSSAPVSHPPQPVQVSPSISAPTNVSLLTTPSTPHPQFNDPQQEYIEILSDNSDELTIEDSNVQLAIEESISHRLQNDQDHFDSVEELLQHHTLMKCFVAVVPEDRQNIVVRRKHIWNDVKRSLKRPGFNDNIGLLINFIGEDAHDAGGPRREFFRLVMSSMSRDGNLFTGPPSNKTLTHNVIALQRNEFHICGHLIALSLLYGGPAPNFLSKSVVAYLLDEPLDTTMIEDIPDSDTQSSLRKLLDASSSEELRALFNSSEFNFRFDAGVTISASAVNIEEKEEIILAFVNNYLMYSCKGELDQFKNGLKSLGILELLQQYPTLMKPLFVYSEKPCMKAATLLNMFTVKWSPEGSNTRELEEAVIYCWTNYVHQCAGSGRQVGEVAVNLSSILIFVTGLDCIPALGFASPLEIEFIKDNDKGRLPSASTCTPALYLPLSLTDEDVFFERMDTAIIGAQMFGVP